MAVVSTLDTPSASITRTPAGRFEFAGRVLMPRTKNAALAKESSSSMLGRVEPHDSNQRREQRQRHRSG
jgi:hypothetical protein